MSHLASYAVLPENQPRLHEELHSQNRSAFEIDRERILRSSAFRRLDYKTQVFVPHEISDHFRTRLTHSLEVAQVSRRLAKALGCDQDLAEAVALAHDLGHPPFGHVGEKVLSQLMKPAGGFEHNNQSLRIVDYLEHPYPNFRGLNLSQATRESIALHETAYDKPAVDQSQFPKANFAPLAGQLVARADEIAYTCADLEDAFAVRWVDAKKLANFDLWSRAYKLAQTQYPNAKPIHHRIAAIRNLLELLVENVISTTRQNLLDHNIETVEQVKNAPVEHATFDNQIACELRSIQRFLFENVYKHEKILEQDLRTEQIVRFLFSAFVSDPDKHLPTRYVSRIDNLDHLDKVQSVERVCCDYLAGMTDRFCTQLYAKVSCERK